METWGVTAIASVCICIGGVSFGVLVVLLVQWFSHQETQIVEKPVPHPSQTLIQDEQYGSSWLVMTFGPKRGSTFLLDRSVMRIGRDPDNEIVIDHPQVSRKHARLLWQNNQVIVEDLGSSNGTYINKVRIPGQQSLTNGDVLGIGGVVLLTYYK